MASLLHMAVSCLVFLVGGCTTARSAMAFLTIDVSDARPTRSGATTSLSSLTSSSISPQYWTGYTATRSCGPLFWPPKRVTKRSFNTGTSSENIGSCFPRGLYVS